MKQVKCPHCSKPALFAPENPFRPFCSERCKMIDLGDWAEGRYAIPVQAPVDPEELEAALEEAINEINFPGNDDGDLH